MIKLGSFFSNTIWLYPIFAILSVFIARRILLRIAPEKKPGITASIYVWLVTFCLLALTLGLSTTLIDSINNIATLPRYTAKVVDHHTYQETIEETDSDGFSTTREVTMHQAIVTFTDKKGHPVRARVDVSSGSPDKIGSFITVGYKPGMETVIEISGRKIGLLAGACILLLIMGYVSYAGIAFALGKEMTGIWKMGTNGLIYFIIPTGILSFLGLLSYASYQYFAGNKPDMPLWALCLCLFFIVVLFFSFWGYIKWLINGSDRSSTTRYERTNNVRSW